MVEEIALYIHIPFCKQKCLYCDFPSFSNKEGLMKDYAEALAKELSGVQNKKISSIYIGGGTPTYLSIESLNIIKNSIDKLNKNEDIEFTVEGNPGTFQEEKLDIFKKMGVNRLSIGFQAYQENLLKKLGRIHNVEDFVKSYDMARSFNIKDINVDLMFGLPGQTLDMWKETLEKVISMQPEHMSCYSLIVEEGTTFYDFYKSGNLILPEEDEEREMYRFAVELLAKNGYIQYEISNFAKPGFECKHNLVYWSLGNYIGCGLAAHSFNGGRRYYNENQIEKYIKRIKFEENAIMEIHENSLKDNIEEFIFLGLRKTAGISISEFNSKFDRDIYALYGDVIDKYVKLNLLNIAQDRLFLTFEGIEVSNTIMADFILDNDFNSKIEK